MDSLRPDILVGHLVAWHNRHRLVRRITTAHVHSVGYVVLPFARGAAGGLGEEAAARSRAGAAGGDGRSGDSGATLRERAMARAREATTPGLDAVPATAAAPAKTAPPGRGTPDEWPLFTENFIPPLKPAQVAAFALDHAALHAAPGKDARVRQVHQEGGAANSELRLRWLLTAQIEVGSARTRVLVGTGLTPAVLGRRLWNLPLLAALGLGVAGAVALVAVWLRPLGPWGAPDPAASSASAASAASAVGAASAASSSEPAAAGPALPGMHGPAADASAAAGMRPASSPASNVSVEPLPVAAAPGSLPLTTAAAAPASPASAPIDVEPTLGRVDLPSLGPYIDEKRRAARERAAALAASAGGAKPTATAAMPTGPVFAVSTRLLRTQTESRQMAEALRALLVTPDSRGLQVEAFRAGDDWRVVGWPYGSREQAEKVRTALAARGLKVEVIEF